MVHQKRTDHLLCFLNGIFSFAVYVDSHDYVASGFAELGAFVVGSGSAYSSCGIAEHWKTGNIELSTPDGVVGFSFASYAEG